MGTCMSTPSGAWTRQPLSRLWKLQEHASGYFASPRMTLVRAKTRFGRLGHHGGPLALLVTVVFQNERKQHILLRSLTIKYGGAWYQPIHFPGDQVHLLYHEGQHDIQLPRTLNIITAPYIPPATTAERCALFRLPESQVRWPTHLRVIAKATFVRRRSRSLVVTLSN
jgi:hypothetical protein